MLRHNKGFHFNHHTSYAEHSSQSFAVVLGLAFWLLDVVHSYEELTMVARLNLQSGTRLWQADQTINRQAIITASPLFRARADRNVEPQDYQLAGYILRDDCMTAFLKSFTIHRIVCLSQLQLLSSKAHGEVTRQSTFSKIRSSKLIAEILTICKTIE